MSNLKMNAPNNFFALTAFSDFTTECLAVDMRPVILLQTCEDVTILCPSWM
jgi:hypothetical protein